MLNATATITNNPITSRAMTSENRKFFSRAIPFVLNLTVVNKMNPALPHRLPHKYIHYVIPIFRHQIGSVAGKQDDQPIRRDKGVTGITITQ